MQYHWLNKYQACQLCVEASIKEGLDSTTDLIWQYQISGFNYLKKSRTKTGIWAILHSLYPIVELGKNALRTHKAMTRP